MNPWIHEIIDDLDESDAVAVGKALDELEFLFDALDDIDRDVAQQLIDNLSQRLAALQQAP